MNGREVRELTIRPLTAGDWEIVEKLFGPRGACGGCWCMYWRFPRGGRLWEENKGDPNRRSMEKLVKADKVFACLAFSEGEPVGWCCLGPRADFPMIERKKALATDWNETTWSVVCFFIDRKWRSGGVASALLAEAVKLARSKGARELEAYPVPETWNFKGKIPAAFAYTGLPSMFRKLNFRDVTPAGNSQPIFKLTFE